ncbi:hypothetical protein ACFV0O_28415 [Kitasatospora sp. NPDC059577]|uniref:hypothetical protein n=1 Tax=Kitasatospora sp. NPDC059577 TaxID=3346873 RepID=UPI00367AD12A
MSPDDTFARLLRDAADLAPAPSAAGLADGARRHHRRHRRRQAVLTGGAALTAAAVVALAVWHPGADAGTGTATAPTAGWPEQITARFMTDTLTSVLPPGRIGATHGNGVGDGPVPGLPPSAFVLYDDGNGAGMVNLTINRAALPITDATRGTQCVDPVEAPSEGCERTVLPDGGIVVVDKLAPDAQAQVTKWQATYTGTDGRQVGIWEVNSTSFGPPLSRPAPPLTSAQLVAAVTSSAWNPVFANPAPTGTTGTAPAASGPAPAQILATATTLLPPGAVTDSGAAQHTPGQAHLSLTLEGRTSMLAVHIQPRPGDKAEAAREREAFEQDTSGTLTHAPDGSSVLVRETGATKTGGGPTLWWSVEVLHPDGTRVLATEWNGTSEAQALPGTPALTVDQLRTIATAPAWRP